MTVSAYIGTINRYEKFDCRLAGKQVCGGRKTGKPTFDRRQRKIIYLATDCEADFNKKVLAEAKTYGVKAEVCGTRAEFAKLCEIEVPCAVIGILKK